MDVKVFLVTSRLCYRTDLRSVELRSLVKYCHLPNVAAVCPQARRSQSASVPLPSSSPFLSLCIRSVYLCLSKCLSRCTVSGSLSSFFDFFFILLEESLPKDTKEEKVTSFHINQRGICGNQTCNLDRFRKCVDNK